MDSFPKKAIRKAKNLYKGDPGLEHLTRHLPAVLRLASEAGSLEERREWTDAIDRWQEIAARLGARTPPAVYVKISTAYRNIGRFGRAEKTIQEAFILDDQNIDLNNEFAQIAHSAGDWSKAVERWQRIIKDFGETADVSPAYIRLIDALCNLKDFERAETESRNALKRWPENVQLRMAEARIFEYAQRWPEAKKYWQRIIKDFGEKFPAGVRAGLALSCLKLSLNHQAENEIKKGLALAPDDLELRFLLAETAEYRQDWPVALSRWETIWNDIEVSPSVQIRKKLRVRFNVSVLRRLSDIKAYRSNIDTYRKSSGRKKYAVYTSFTGSYDQLKLPEIIDSRFDYIVFTDEKVDDHGIWKVRPLNQLEFKDDGSRASRYPKTHPHVLMKEYEIAIWTDTSLMITGDLMPLIEEFAQSGLPIGNPTHPQRQSLSEELEACIDLKKDDPEILRRQLKFYESINFDTKDLANNGVLFFNLKNKKLAAVMDTWWEQILTFSKRDQLSFNYALYINKAERFRLTHPPTDIRNHPVFVFVPHHQGSQLLDNLYEQLS